MNLQEFINPKLLILVAMLWALGYILKKHPRFKADWLIPFILVIVGVIVTVIYTIFVVEGQFTAAIVVTAIVQGVLIAGLAVLINEGAKQVLKKRPVDQLE